MHTRPGWWWGVVMGGVVASSLAVWAAAPGQGGGAVPPSPPGKGMGRGMGMGMGMGMNAQDTRTPVPLLPMMALHQKMNMRDHLAAVTEVLTALQAHDVAAVEMAARRLGTTEEMTMMCNHMGAVAPGFTDAALGFHRTADGIAVAARAKDEAAVLKATTATLATCVSCHATFRQDVVDRATWEQKTGKAAPGPAQ